VGDRRIERIKGHDERERTVRFRRGADRIGGGNGAQDRPFRFERREEGERI
jgi:hypothetical protein